MAQCSDVKNARHNRHFKFHLEIIHISSSSVGGWMSPDVVQFMRFFLFCLVALRCTHAITTDSAVLVGAVKSIDIRDWCWVCVRVCVGVCSSVCIVCVYFFMTSSTRLVAVSMPCAVTPGPYVYYYNSAFVRCLGRARLLLADCLHVVSDCRRFMSRFVGQLVLCADTASAVLIFEHFNALRSSRFRVLVVCTRSIRVGQKTARN